jgi:hypothetical protein
MVDSQVIGFSASCFYIYEESAVLHLSFLEILAVDLLKLGALSSPSNPLLVLEQQNRRPAAAREDDPCSVA